MGRLTWLNSTLGNDDTPTRGYTPIRVDESTVSCLGRRVALGSDGLPSSILSFFNPANTKIVAGPGLELLAAPVRIAMTDSTGRPLTTGASIVHMGPPTAGSVAWTATTPVAMGWA